MRKILLVAGLMCGAAVPVLAADAAPANKSSSGSFTGATANLAPGDAPGQWTRQARDYSNTRYSPLAQINQKNVGRLRVAWTFSDGQMYGHEGAPLVVGDTMYLVTPFPNIAYALDLSKAGAPIKWVFQPNPDPRAIGEGLLRQGAARLGLCRRQADLQSAGRSHRGGGRQDRQGSVARPAGRRQQRHRP